MPAKQNNKKKNVVSKKQGRMMPMTIQPIARVQKAYFGYGVYSTLTEPSAATGAIYQFRLNSVYDPDYSSTGSVAQGYTAYTGLYALFRVVRTRVMVRFYSGSTGNMTVGFIPGMNQTLTANYAYLQAQPYAKSAVLQGNVGGAHSVKQFDQVLDLPKVAGLSKTQYMVDLDFAHSVGVNPVRPLYLTLFINGHSAAVQSVGFEIRLVYEVQMSQPLDAVTN